MDTMTQGIADIFYAVPELVRYLLIFFSAGIEGVPVIGSVFPGGTVALLVGSLSEGGFVWAPLAVFLIAVGTFCGDLVGYAAGSRLREHRWLKRFVESEKNQKGWDVFDRHVAIVIIFGKLIPVVRSTPSIFAAMRGVRLRRYMFYSALGSILWAFAGIYGGSLMARVLGENAAIMVILGLLVVSGIVFLYKRLKPKKKS